MDSISIHPELSFIFIESLRDRGYEPYQETVSPFHRPKFYFVLPSEEVAIPKGLPADTFLVYEYLNPSTQKKICYPNTDAMVEFLASWCGVSPQKGWTKLFPTYEHSELGPIVQIFWNAMYLPKDNKMAFITQSLKDLSVSAFVLYQSMVSWKSFIEQFLLFQKKFSDSVIQVFLINFLEKVLTFIKTRRLPPNPVFGEVVQRFAVKVTLADLVRALLLLYKDDTTLFCRVVSLRNILWLSGE